MSFLGGLVGLILFQLLIWFLFLLYVSFFLMLGFVEFKKNVLGIKQLSSPNYHNKHFTERAVYPDPRGMLFKNWITFISFSKITSEFVGMLCKDSGMSVHRLGQGAMLCEPKL